MNQVAAAIAAIKMALAFLGDSRDQDDAAFAVCEQLREALADLQDIDRGE
jgi:hypothetical protein